MTTDLNKNITTIKYNYLNLPDTVQMSNGDMIDFGYDATGTKTFSTHSTANSSSSGVTMPIGYTLKNNTAGITTQSSETVMYLDNMIYENWNLDKIQITDGLLIRSNAVTATTPTFTYNYYVKDHLGNIRAVFHDAGNGTPIVDQVNNYYPFGMEYGESAEDTVAEGYQNYLFSGKEFDRKFEVNTYDFGARSYDATESHWLSLDPLCEMKPWISPYVYCNNNPMNRIDPDGMADYFGNNGKYYGNDGAKNDDVRVTTQDNWNKMQTTNDKGNITYNTDYKTNQSVAFSQAQDISEDATLDVYQHYNPTDLSLRANASENGSSGGAFWYKRDGSAEGIEINIQGNKSLGISDHSNEIKNTFVHEKQHYDDYTELGVKAYIAMPNDQKEQRTVSVSIKDETFNKMRANIQELKKEYGAKHGLMYPISPINPLQKK